MGKVNALGYEWLIMVTLWWMNLWGALDGRFETEGKLICLFINSNIVVQKREKGIVFCPLSKQLMVT